MPPRAWIVASASFLLAYGFMFSVVHVRADTRPCVTGLEDPLFGIIPHDPRWYAVTHSLYYVFTAAGTLAFAWTAVRGDHRSLVRFGAGLALQALIRCLTITLLPLCRFGLAPGTVALDEAPTIDLGFAAIPFVTWATNDLVFSGHVGEFLLMSFCARGWPAPARWALWLFQPLQAYGLLATRGHYTIDILLAVPCAFLADAVAVRVLGRLAAAPAPARA